MALRTFGASYVINCNPGAFAALYFFLEPGVFQVEFIVQKLHFGCPVAFYAPSHAQRLYLAYSVHVSYIPMAFCTVQFAGTNMLGMIEIGMIGQVMHPDPLNRFSGFNSLIDLVDFFCPAVSSLTHHIMAIHA
jgi:hypothetical protein